MGRTELILERAPCHPPPAHTLAIINFHAPGLVLIVLQHAVAGSVAGLAEHSCMYPIDTIKTLMQVRQAPACHAVAADVTGGGGGGGGVGGAAAAFTRLTSSGGGVLRMWRGVQTMLSGCVPAHAAYFTIYEGCKAAFSQPLPRVLGEEGTAAGGADSAARGNAERGDTGTVLGAGPDSTCSPLAAGAAVALATMAHDVIMTPMDCIKQRLQLGYHRNSLVDCACDMLRHEGPRAFLVSYPTTLLMNVPYALIMGTTNEALRNVLNPSGEHSLPAYLLVRAPPHRIPRSSPSASLRAASLAARCVPYCALRAPLRAARIAARRPHCCGSADPQRHRLGKPSALRPVLPCCHLRALAVWRRSGHSSCCLDESTRCARWRLVPSPRASTGLGHTTAT